MESYSGDLRNSGGKSHANEGPERMRVEDGTRYCLGGCGGGICSISWVTTRSSSTTVKVRTLVFTLDSESAKQPAVFRTAWLGQVEWLASDGALTAEKADALKS